MNASIISNPKYFLVLACWALLTCAQPAAAAQRFDPINRIVIMVDASGSYRARQVEALARAMELLEKVAATRVTRFEDAIDRVAVLSLDAMPEILWEGSLRELKKIDPKLWVQRFKSRTDYAGCTDVTRAFAIAAGFLEGDGNDGGRYIFAFTDMLHEPPASAIGKCRRPEAVASDFPWDAMREVKVDVLWVPGNQKLVWERAAEKRGLMDFKLHTNSESAFVTIKAPPKAEKSQQLKSAEREAAGERLGAFASSIGHVAVIAIYVLLGLMLFGVVLFLALLLFRRRPGARRGGRAHSGG